MKVFQSPEIPGWVVLQLVEECNLRCAMCYEWGTAGAYHEKKELASLSLDVALRLIDEVLPRRPRFELFGGEPLLYRDLWTVISRIRAGGSELAFPTNGTLVERYAEQLVEHEPNRVWLSLDGPEVLNDAQRGRGVFKRALRGLAALTAEKQRRGRRLPEVGITCVVTPANHARIAELFLEVLDLSQIGMVSLELQSFVTEAQYRQYARLLREEFGVPSASYARAYVQDPSLFTAMDRVALARQFHDVRAACEARGIVFYSQPKTIDVHNIDRYLAGDWAAMTGQRSRCAVPWTYAEVSARGDVTTCHTFYDAPIGNVHDQSLLDIWQGAKARQLRDHLRGALLPICTACCRYYQ